MRFGLIEVKDLTPEDVLLLEKSVSLDPYIDTKGILEKCIAGDAQLWRGVEGPSRLIIVTQVNDTSRGLELNVWHLGGVHLRMHRQAKMVHATLERYAYRIGCQRTIAYAVPDMVRTLQYVGYTPTMLRMEKEV